MLDNMNLNRPEPQIIESTLANQADVWKGAQDLAVRAGTAEAQSEYAAVCLQIGSAARVDIDLAKMMAQGYVMNYREDRRLEHYRISRQYGLSTLAVSLTLGIIGAAVAVAAVGAVLV